MGKTLRIASLILLPCVINGNLKCLSIIPVFFYRLFYNLFISKTTCIENLIGKVYKSKKV